MATQQPAFAELLTLWKSKQSSEKVIRALEAAVTEFVGSASVDRNETNYAARLAIDTTISARTMLLRHSSPGQFSMDRYATDRLPALIRIVAKVHRGEAEADDIEWDAERAKSRELIGALAISSVASGMVPASRKFFAGTGNLNFE